MPGDILLAGALPGHAAGLSTMSGIMLDALLPLGHVEMLTHRIAPMPSLWRNGAALPTMTLGVQPFSVHGEAMLAGQLHRRALRKFRAGIAVGSRYAESLRAAGIPYLIWEATTLRDELATIDVAEIRRSGSGTGMGAALYKAFLALDERLEQRLYRDAVAVLALSEYTASRIRALHPLPPGRVRVLPPPPTPEFFRALDMARRNPAPRRNARAGSSAPGQPVPLRLLTVGRLDDPRKNFALLRDAWMALRRSGTDVRLTAVGPCTEKWRRALGLDAESGIEFAGSVPHDDLPRLLLDHDVLVISSRQEGFGIVAAEAMHAGLPVISTRCGGPEQVLRDSGGGLLVDHTAAALMEAIASLAADPARRYRMGEFGRTYAERALSAERFAARVAAEIAQLAA